MKEKPFMKHKHKKTKRFRSTFVYNKAITKSKIVCKTKYRLE